MIVEMRASRQGKASLASPYFCKERGVVAVRTISREIGKFSFQSWWFVVIYPELSGGCVYASSIDAARKGRVGIDTRQGSI